MKMDEDSSGGRHQAWTAAMIILAAKIGCKVPGWEGSAFAPHNKSRRQCLDESREIEQAYLESSNSLMWNCFEATLVETLETMGNKWAKREQNRSKDGSGPQR